eukprot:Protomagalhaensia_wolfi_Nauph_80__4488@NODE_45_length_4272_cov_191_556107_g36_i0_p3_GENE_NODE_45_length_4272_cov_191_556107_g36_i0NODE_45_length_4272_cov_191_556107_g36_i0_p3_ORF_typecomplete_len183_score51_30Ocnus/PF05005_15/1_2e19Sfi1_C/PF10638_9/0_024_NODE_45_length_4272_cov_191_556107_g36_i030923640
MSAAKGCKMLKQIKELNQELGQDTLSPEERSVKQARLKALTKKYEASRAALPQPAVRSAKEIEAALKEIPTAELDPGTHKFVLVKVEFNEEDFYFVRAKDYAKYHYMAAEPLVERLMEIGIPHASIEIPGGGRCRNNESRRDILVYGYSNQYGQPPMERVVMTIKSDSKYAGCSCSYSLEGY